MAQVIEKKGGFGIVIPERVNDEKIRRILGLAGIDGVMGILAIFRGAEFFLEFSCWKKIENPRSVLLFRHLPVLLPVPFQQN
jgi:hypothetical protein